MMPRWIFHACLLGSLWAFLILLHPYPGVFWFDFATALPGMQGKSLSEAIQWDAMQYSPALNRPLKATLWWAAVNVFGNNPFPYYLANIFFLGIAFWCAALVVMRLYD